MNGVMEDCSTDERLQQETLCRRQWTDEYNVRRTSRDVDEVERIVVTSVTLYVFGRLSLMPAPQRSRFAVLGCG